MQTQPGQTQNERSQVHPLPLTGGRVGLLIAVFLLALYPGLILGSHSLFYRDFGLFTYPAAHFIQESLWRGEVPLWNPLNHCGVPFLAQWNTSVCYPLSLIYVLLPLPWGLNLFCVTHLVLAGVGMYLLARRWTENQLAAGVAGMAFGLNGLMINSLIWTSNLAALAWQPLVVLCAERAWRLGGSKRVALASLVGAMQMLSGAPEIILFTWLFLAGLCLADLIREKDSRLPVFRRIGAVVVLVAGISAVQLLPFFDLLAHSERNSANMYADAWPMPASGWINLLVPWFNCFKLKLGSYLQNGQAWTSSYYLGIGVLALALTALLHAKEFRVGWLGATALVGLLLAMGNNGYVYAWLKSALPFIGFARFPIKFVSLVVFAIPLLAAYGCAQVANAERSRRGSSLPFCAITLLLLLAVGVVSITSHRRGSEMGAEILRDGLSRILLLLAIASAVMGWSRIAEPRLRNIVGFALLAVIGLDLASVAIRIHPVVVVQGFSPIELNMSSRPRLGQSRAMVAGEANQYLGYAGTSNALYYCAGTRGALFENCNIAEKIPKVDGFSSVHLQHEMDIWMILYGQTNVSVEPLLDFLGVAQITEAGNLFAWRERTNYMPLVTAGQKPAYADDKQTLKILSSGGFDPRHTVFLPPDARAKIIAAEGSGVKILSHQFSAQRARVEVEASVPAMVVVAQSYYHNWRAFVDGRPAPLWRANHAYQGIEVPAGRHEVTLVYKDLAFRAGALISAVSLLCCLLLLSDRGRKPCEPESSVS